VPSGIDAWMVHRGSAYLVLVECENNKDQTLDYIFGGYADLSDMHFLRFSNSNNK